MEGLPEKRRIRGCKRCGTCCRKGGPSLHFEDRHLVESGIIPLAALVTIRKGEWVYDGRMDAVRRTDREFVRIQGRGNTGWACLYWNPEDHTCRIYPDRPIECRALACWDTDAIEAIYDHPRLTRSDILQHAPSQWIELVRIHEARCGIDSMIDEAASSKSGVENPALKERIAFDEAVRKLTLERSRIDPAVLLFLFGRPLRDVLRQMRTLSGKNPG